MLSLFSERPTIAVCDWIALDGGLETFQWARNQGYPWNESTVSFAAKSGNLVLLRWIIENGCPYLEDVVTSKAAQSGNLDMLRWLIEEKKFTWDDSGIALDVAEGGNIEMLNYVIALGCNIIEKKICEVAAQNNNGEFVRYCVEILEFKDWKSSHLWLQFLTVGDLKMMKFLLAHECPWRRMSLVLVMCRSTRQDLWVVKWILENMGRKTPKKQKKPGQTPRFDQYGDEIDSDEEDEDQGVDFESLEGQLRECARTKELYSFLKWFQEKGCEPTEKETNALYISDDPRCRIC